MDVPKDDQSGEVSLNDSPGRLCQINKKMLRFKLHFFSYIGSMGITVPYISIIATSSVGLSGSSLGTILTFQQILYLLVNPIIGYVTDYFNRLKGMICILTLLFAVSVCLLLPIPSIKSTTNNQLKSCLTLKRMPLNVTSFRHQNYTVFYSNKTETTDSLEKFFTSHIFNSHATEISCKNHVLHHVRNLSDYLFNKSVRSCVCEDYGPEWHDEELSELQNLSDHTQISMNKTRWVIFCPYSAEYFMASCQPEPSEPVTDFKTYQFWVVGLLLTVIFTCVNALLTLSDTACQESVRRSGSDYGRQRLFGSFGFAIMTVIGGSLYDLTGGYIASFAVMWVLITIVVLNVLGMKLSKPTFSKGMLKEFQAAIKSRDFLLFLAGVLLNGAGASVTRYYLLVYLTDLGSSRSLTGLVVGMQNLIEIPFMFFSGWVISKIGQFGVLAASLLAYCLRFLCYSYLYDPWWAVAIELFQGVTCGLFYPAATSFAKLKARPGTEATTQAVVFTVYDGFGLALGSFLFGVSYDYLGGKWAFLYGSVLFGCGALTFFIGSLFLVKRQEKPLSEQNYAICDSEKK